MLRRCGGPVHRRSYSRGSVTPPALRGGGLYFVLDKAQLVCYLMVMKTAAMAVVKEPLVGMRVYSDTLDKWGTITDLGGRGVWLRWDEPLHGVWESFTRWDRLLTPREV